MNTAARQDVSALQGFLKARGHYNPLTGTFCRQTVVAAQTYLRGAVDAGIAVDGICGPHTARTLESVKGEIQRRSPPRSGTGVRLVMHTTSRKKSDFYTFEAEAMRLEREYRKEFPNDVVRRVLVSNGKQIAKVINACQEGTIVSWDVLSHSNAGGIHISEDLAQPKSASADRQRRHLQHRSGGRNAQSAKDAEFMEEDMRGMYTSRATTKLVADYFNQQPTAVVSTLEEIKYDRFSSDCYVELHGCRTVNDDAFSADLFIAVLSALLPSDSTTVGHTGGSFPKGSRGYRHGEVGVFRGGQEMHRCRRESLKLPNASTPGQDDETFPETPRQGSRSCRTRTTTTEGRRDFKTDWPTSRCPPRTGTNPPPGDNVWPPPPGTGTNPPPRDDTWPPTPGTGTNPPPRDDTTPPTPRTGTNPPPRDDRNPRTPQTGSNPRDDRDRRRGDPQGSDVPWAAILTGAAVVGGIALERKNRRDRERDRDRGGNDRGGNDRGGNDRGGNDRSNPRSGLGSRLGSLGTSNGRADAGRQLLGSMLGR